MALEWVKRKLGRGNDVGACFLYLTQEQRAIQLAFGPHTLPLREATGARLFRTFLGGSNDWPALAEEATTLFKEPSEERRVECDAPFFALLPGVTVGAGYRLAELDMKIKSTLKVDGIYARMETGGQDEREQHVSAADLADIETQIRAAGKAVGYGGDVSFMKGRSHCQVENMDIVLSELKTYSIDRCELSNRLKALDAAAAQSVYDEFEAVVRAQQPPRTGQNDDEHFMSPGARLFVPIAFHVVQKMSVHTGTKRSKATSGSLKFSGKASGGEGTASGKHAKKEDGERDVLLTMSSKSGEKGVVLACDIAEIVFKKKNPNTEDVRSGVKVVKVEGIERAVQKNLEGACVANSVDIEGVITDECAPDDFWWFSKEKSDDSHEREPETKQAESDQTSADASAKPEQLSDTNAQS